MISSSFGITDRGLVRETNEDQFLIAQLNKSMKVTGTSLPLDPRLDGNVQGELLLVADGMGGHAAGEQASRLAIGHLVRRLLNRVHWYISFEDDRDGRREQSFLQDLQLLLQDAHARILLESSQNVQQRGMGTTLTMAHLVWPRLYVVHAGDSRCYLIRQEVATPLTTDHTLARQMVQAGGLRPEEEADSKWSNVLWNVLGGRGDGELIAEVRRIDLQPGDTIVLCSDGLHRYVSDDVLSKVVREAASVEAACRQLVEIAKAGGGEDNITVVISHPLNEDVTTSTWIEEFDTAESPPPATP